MAINYRSRAVSNSKVGRNVRPHKTPKFRPEAKLKTSKAHHQAVALATPHNPPTTINSNHKGDQ